MGLAYKGCNANGFTQITSGCKTPGVIVKLVKMGNISFTCGPLSIDGKTPTLINDKGYTYPNKERKGYLSQSHVSRWLKVKSPTAVAINVERHTRGFYGTSSSSTRRKFSLSTKPNLSRSPRSATSPSTSGSLPRSWNIIAPTTTATLSSSPTHTLPLRLSAKPTVPSKVKRKPQ